MATERPTEEVRLALCEWLAANGIAPNVVPLDDPGIRITEQDGQRVIRYTEFVRSELTGNILVDPDKPEPITSRATTPLIVEPPAWLRVPEGDT